jgi:hypothetical protein
MQNPIDEPHALLQQQQHDRRHHQCPRHDGISGRDCLPVPASKSYHMCKRAVIMGTIAGCYADGACDPRKVHAYIHDHTYSTRYRYNMYNVLGERRCIALARRGRQT